MDESLRGKKCEAKWISQYVTLIVIKSNFKNFLLILFYSYEEIVSRDERERYSR